VETPRYSTGQRLAKRGLDLLLASIALILLSPVMAAIALRIRSAKDGPVLFRISSGRSTLSWEETVRLDLSYVENWTLIGDLVILFKTAKAVLAPGSTAA
jgi:lipopolysaccharide/colanic/teichoic acid biosynthesis glycosyltransferase